MASSVELQNISKRFGAVGVISSLDLTVEEGSFCALLGASGSGKSTLLRMIAGLEGTTEGRVLIGGVDVTHTPPAKRKVAMVFQSYALYPHLTVRDNICFSMSLAGEPKAKQNERAAQVAKMLQLESLMDRRPAQLSGGQRQRVAIGRALVRNPEVFLFDEPLSNLDALLRVQMRLELAKLHKELKTTMIYVTHDQVEAMTLADKIVVLDKGKVSQVGRPLELYNAPANRFVASFIGSPAMNFINAEVLNHKGKSLRLALPENGKIELQARNQTSNLKGAKLEIGIRPEHFHLVAPTDKRASIKGKAAIVEQLGNTTYTYMETAVGQLIVEGEGSAQLSSGQSVGLEIDSQHAHIFDTNGNVV
jgi:ABC-type sugar transport system ATPase subunit